MKRFRCHSLLIAAWLAVVPALCAQQATPPMTIVLKDGRTVVTPGLSRSGDNIMATVQVGAGTGQVGYAVSNIERLEFPEPAQLKVARELFAQGKLPDGLAALAPIIRFHEPFRDVPGSYWAQAVVLKLNAWISAGNESEAAVLISQLKAVTGNSEIERIARVQEAANWTRQGQYEKALPVYEAVIQESTNRDVLAAAWLNKGHSLLGLKQAEAAVLAYLRIAVFYPEDRQLLAPALLGSARALVVLEDFPAAELRLYDLVKSLPNVPEATVAKAELEKLKKKKP
jgi:tetratricopeptide (TPR) repeat protein